MDKKITRDMIYVLDVVNGTRKLFELNEAKCAERNAKRQALRLRKSLADEIPATGIQSRKVGRL